MLKEYLSEIANAIRSKLETEDKKIGKINAQSFPDKINEVYEKGSVDGVKAKNDEMWKKLLNNGNSKGYDFFFMGRAWNDDTFNPTCNIKVGYDCMVSMFQYCGVQDLRGILARNNVVLDTSEGGNMTNMFLGARIVHMPTLNLTKGKPCGLFYELTSLKTVEKLIVNENYAFGQSFFQNCKSLYEITFEGNIGTNLNAQWCPFKKESIINIIEHLWDGAVGKKLVLNKKAVNDEFGIDVDDETTFPEGSEYYVLRHSKDNWDIDYI